MTLSSARQSDHVAIPSSRPRMAVNNCRPSSTRFIAISFEHFAWLHSFLLWDINAAISEMASDQSPSEKTNDMSWNFCTGRFLTF
jgi:hypothetical protein